MMMKYQYHKKIVGLGAALTAMLALACESRNEDWDESVNGDAPIGLSGSIALLDTSLDRMVFLHSERDLKLSTTIFPMSENVTTRVASKDASKLFVLSSGVFPRTTPEDEPPMLQVFDGGSKPKLEHSFILDDPMRALALDPADEWVAAYQGDAAVTNPNELVLLSLTDESETPYSRTIRSFGGAPEELIFTDSLSVPKGGERRFLVVRTDRDITLVDLKKLDNSEVTIKLPESESGTPFAPAQVIYSEGDPDNNSDTRFAVRLQNSSDIVLLTLGDSDNASKDFSVTVNIVDVGGSPSTIDFVQTDGGLRLAALVPSLGQATLVNPETTLSEKVDLPQGFREMTRITGLLGDTPEGGDVALLWGNSTQIAFWSLGSTSSSPYSSVDATELDMMVTSVLDVPAPNEHLKVLLGQGGSRFFVLDLKKRESFPLHTEGTGFDVQVSGDGLRLWVTQNGSNRFSAVDLADLHPEALFVSPTPTELFDIEQEDGNRAAVVIHREDGWAATLLNALNPDSSKSKYYPSLELRGLQ